MKRIVNTIVIIGLFVVVFIGVYVINTTVYYTNIPDAIRYLAKTIEGSVYILIGGVGLLLEMYHFVIKKNSTEKDE